MGSSSPGSEASPKSAQQNVIITKVEAQDLLANIPHAGGRQNPGYRDAHAALPALVMPDSTFWAGLSTVMVDLTAPNPQAAGDNSNPATDGSTSLWDDTWALDMELIHHYVTEAYRTLPRSDEVGNVWQTDAVKSGLTHKYLLHQILAFSAYHLAYLRPDQQRRYYCAAAQHQSQGIQDMRPDLMALDANNCHSLFMAASFIAIGNFSALAIHARDGAVHSPSVDDIVDVFVLLRGMRVVLSSWETTIQQGPFAEMFTFTSYNGPLQFWREVNERVHLVREFLNDKLAHDPATSMLIEHEVLRLPDVSERSLSLSSDPELRFTMLWPIDVSSEYLQLLRGRNLGALVVLGYYCVIVNATGSKTWFTREWPAKLLRAIEMLLPSAWAEIIDWPLERVCRNPAPLGTAT